MPLAHITQVVVKGKVDQQDYRNVMHFGSDVTGFDTDPNAILIALAAAVFECFVTVLLPGLSNNIRLDGVSAKRIFPTVTDEVFASSGAGVGGVGTHSLPGFCSTLVDIKTGGGGKRNRGRMFLPPPLEAGVALGTLDSPALTLITDFCQCFIGKFLGVAGTSEWQVGVLSRAAIVQDSAAINVAFKPATSITPVSLVAVQRRRKIGKGS